MQAIRRHSIFYILSAIIFLTFSTSAGGSQSGFADNGLVVTDFPGFPSAASSDIAVDNAGRIVVSGVVGDWAALPSPDQFGVVRYLPGGEIDAAFGVAGRAVTAFGGTRVSNEAALGIDGQNRIVLAGGGTNINPGVNEYALARFHGNGSLDLGFDADGLLTTAFPDSFFDHARDLVITPGNRIVAVGSTNFSPAIGGTPNSFSLAGYQENGGMDGGFGNAGFVTTVFPDAPEWTEARGVARDSSGRLVVAGSSFNPDPSNIAVARYLAGGDLDPTFSGDGTVIIQFDTDVNGHDVAVDAEGRILVAGCLRSNVAPVGALRGFALLRLLENGDPDPAFGNNGWVTTEFIHAPGEDPSGCAWGIVIDPLGRIVLAGATEDGTGHSVFAVARYLDNGDLDPSFGTGGQVTTSFPGQNHSSGRAVTLDPQGRIFVTGVVRLEGEEGFDNRFGVACYNEYGYPCRDLPYEYSAKVVCGEQSDPSQLALTQGLYATTVNIHNPGTRPVTFFKKLALTRPPREQAPGQVLPIAEDLLHYDQALSVDCPDIERRLFNDDDGFPGGFIEGFVVIQSAASLDVTAVYTSSDLEDAGTAGAHSSIDVEQIRERLPDSDLNVAKSAEVVEFPIFDQMILHAVLYTVTVNNSGTNPAAGVGLLDELTLATNNVIGNMLILEAPMDLPPGGSVTQLINTGQSGSLEVSVGNIAGGGSATVRFWAIVLTYQFESPPQALLTNTATVFSDSDEAQPVDNSVTIETILLP